MRLAPQCAEHTSIAEDGAIPLCHNEPRAPAKAPRRGAPQRGRDSAAFGGQPLEPFLQSEQGPPPCGEPDCSPRRVRAKSNRAVFCDRGVQGYAEEQGAIGGASAATELAARKNRAPGHRSQNRAPSGVWGEAPIAYSTPPRSWRRPRGERERSPPLAFSFPFSPR